MAPKDELPQKSPPILTLGSMKSENITIFPAAFPTTKRSMNQTKKKKKTSKRKNRKGAKQEMNERKEKTRKERKRWKERKEGKGIQKRNQGRKRKSSVCMR